MKTFTLLFVIFLGLNSPYKSYAQSATESIILGEFIDLVNEMDTHFAKYRGEIYSDKGEVKQYLSTYKHKGALTTLITNKKGSSSYGVFYDLVQEPELKKKILADYIAIFLELEKNGYKVSFDTKKVQAVDYSVMKLDDNKGVTLSELNINSTEFMLIIYHYDY